VDSCDFVWVGGSRFPVEELEPRTHTKSHEQRNKTRTRPSERGSENRISMNQVLEHINRAERDEAESMFRDCCGSSRWASLMTALRPFASESELIDTAAEIWNGLLSDDWLEAFRAHPMIGETKRAPAQQERSAAWSAGEQAGMNAADEQLKQELANANRRYYDKFGFIFIVCASGKSAEEMLELCRTRLNNDRETELGIAAGEQEKITKIRLRKLCGR